MCELNERIYCILVALMAYVVGIPECIFKYYLLANNPQFNFWYLGFLIAWSLIFIAAIFLIVGVLLDKYNMVMTWLIVAIIFGVIVIIFKVWELLFVWKDWGIIFGIISIVFYGALIFCFLYYPYLYQSTLESEGI
nr:uncharacterized protein LOC108123070 [Drosophila bipectinata]